MDDGAKERLSRRKFLGNTSAVLAAAAVGTATAAGQDQQSPDQHSRGDRHTGTNEKEIGPQNATAEHAERDSVFPPETDAGGQPPFKYPFAFAHRRIEEGGWTRQVTVRDLSISKKMAGVVIAVDTGGTNARVQITIPRTAGLFLYGGVLCQV